MSLFSVTTRFQVVFPGGVFPSPVLHLILICIVLKYFVGLKEKRVCIQFEFVPESILSLLFISAKEGCEPYSHPIILILMRKCAMFSTYFCPLVNETHICKELREEIWIYFEKTNHADSLLLQYLQKFAAYLNLKGKRIPEC